MDGSVANERGSGGGVLATYREIAERFGLQSGPDAGRMKAKRSGWPPEPGNHPLDPVRVRVPREAWDAAASSRSGRNRAGDSSEQEGANKADLVRAMLARIEGRQAEALREAQALAERRGAEVAELREKLARQEAIVEGLQPLVARLEADREAITAELASVYREAQEAREAADRRAVELAEVRERAGRAEAERDRADQRMREMTAERDQAAHQVETVRAELALWREGGPIARAVRAFLYRKR